MEGDNGMEGNSEEGDGDDDNDNDWSMSLLLSVLNRSAAPSAIASFPPHSTSPNIDPTGYASVCDVCLQLPPHMQVVAGPMGRSSSMGVICHISTMRIAMTMLAAHDTHGNTLTATTITMTFCCNDNNQRW